MIINPVNERGFYLFSLFCSQRHANQTFHVVGKMAWDLIFWVLCFVINIALLASTFYQLLLLSDLEADHLNPFEASTRINSVVLPEFLLQGLLCVIFLLTWHWFMFLLAVPLSAYHLMLYFNRKHLLDVTEIFRDLNIEKRYRFVKLCTYLVLFTVVLFRLLPAGVFFFFPSKFEELDIRSSLFY